MVKGIIHNSFYLRNHRKENLSSLLGYSQGTDMDIYDFKFGENEELLEIHMNEENEK